MRRREGGWNGRVRLWELRSRKSELSSWTCDLGHGRVEQSGSCGNGKAARRVGPITR